MPFHLSFQPQIWSVSIAEKILSEKLLHIKEEKKKKKLRNRNLLFPCPFKLAYMLSFCKVHISMRIRRHQAVLKWFVLNTKVCRKRCTLSSMACNLVMWCEKIWTGIYHLEAPYQLNFGLIWKDIVHDCMSLFPNYQGISCFCRFLILANQSHSKIKIVVPSIVTLGEFAGSLGGPTGTGLW